MDKSKQCSKCNRNFRSLFLLQKHINRKIPCDVVIKCDNCGKVFSEDRILKKHIMSKTACPGIIKLNNILDKSTNTSNIKNNIKNGIKNNIELQIKLEKEKADIQNELEKKRHARAMELLDKRILVNKSRIEVEREKTQRKEKTVSIINSNNNINSNNEIYNNYINYITNNYVPTNVVTIDKLEKYVKQILYKSSESYYLNLYKDNNSYPEVAKQVLTECYNHEQFQVNRCLYFSEELDKFFGIYRNIDSSTNKREVKQVDFKKEIYPISKYLLDESYKQMIDTVSNSNSIFEYNSSDDSSDEEKNIEKAVDAECKLVEFNYQFNKSKEFPEDLEICCKKVTNVLIDNC